MAADIDVGSRGCGAHGIMTAPVKIPGSGGGGSGSEHWAQKLPLNGMLSRSADALTTLAGGGGGSPPWASYMARSSFAVPSEQRKPEPELLKSVQRKLVGDASLFFDILSEGESEQLHAPADCSACCAWNIASLACLNAWTSP